MCDTLGVYKTKTFNGQNVVGKNSDRPVAEAQPLVFFSGEVYEAGSVVECTHLTIPQTDKTYAVIGSKPDWIWGFEMGVNEHGLFIGNEAEGSRNAEHEVEGLLGMDLVRLTLERSRNCREGIDVLSKLLQTYGQNANASLLYEHRYENSFMLADTDEIWILETAGREWAARCINDRAALSNCYTIETEFDMASDGLVKTAIQNGWQNPHRPFHFAKAYTLPASRQTHAAARFRRNLNLLAESDCHDFESVKTIFRDHMEGTVEAPRFSAEAGQLFSLCMHPQTWQSPKTAASLLVSYDAVLGPVMRHAFSMPCTSVYMPVYFTGYLPAGMQQGGRRFNSDSLWWQIERLCVAVSADTEAFKEQTVSSLRTVEERIESRRDAHERQAKDYLLKGQREQAYAVLNQYMDDSAALIQETVQACYRDIAAAVRNDGGVYGPCREMVLWYEEHCDIKL